MSAHATAAQSPQRVTTLRTTTVFRGLRELRLHAGLSLARLADLTGINKGTLSGIERGRVVATADELHRIGEALDVRLENRTIPGRDEQVLAR